MYCAVTVREATAASLGVYVAEHLLLVEVAGNEHVVAEKEPAPVAEKVTMPVTELVTVTVQVEAWLTVVGVTQATAVVLDVATVIGAVPALAACPASPE